MRALKTALLIAGVVILGYLVHRVGAGAIADTLKRLAWWQLVLICLPYALVNAVDALGWRYAFARTGAPYWRLYGARLAGEALNVIPERCDIDIGVRLLPGEFSEGAVAMVEGIARGIAAGESGWQLAAWGERRQTVD